MTAPQTCTTWSYRRRHLSVDGCHRTLCNCAAETQAGMDAWARRYGRKGINERIADLPACKLCEKAAAKLAVA